MADILNKYDMKVKKIQNLLSCEMSCSFGKQLLYFHQDAID